jgi:hypothetical protein
MRRKASLDSELESLIMYDKQLCEREKELDKVERWLDGREKKLESILESRNVRL